MERKVLTKSQMEEWLKKFYPDENLDKLFEEDNKSPKEDTWGFINLKGTFIAKMIVRSFDTFGSRIQHVDLERYIVLPQVNMFF